MSLSMRAITKSFSSNAVLKGVDFALEDGEIRALIGENGAGKTTLMNILGGVLRPDAGVIELDGKRVEFASPRDSLAAGIAFIHQELNLVNDLNVYENLFLGRERVRGAFTDTARMREEARAVLERMGMALDPCAMVRDLDASYKQVVEIARALLFDARVIIMDEPTTSLTEPEIERVFSMMRTVKEQGVSIVFISHKLREVLEICDTYTVLRDGVNVAAGATRETTEAELARHMVGHEVSTRRLAREGGAGEVALEVEGLSQARAFEDISFSLRAGEILGVTGLLGDGRSELFQTLFGYRKRDAGRVRVFGREMALGNTTQARRAGIGYVPRDRKENGILKDMSILENASIVTLRELSHFLLLDRKRERAEFARNVQELSIRLADENDPITSLSGGNQQKVVLAKWLSAHPRILIFDNPTQGVDVGAKEEIYEIILRLAAQGVAIAVLSSEAQEIIRLCDRVLVMYHGRIAGELAGERMTEHGIMVLATGGEAV